MSALETASSSQAFSTFSAHRLHSLPLPPVRGNVLSQDSEPQALVLCSACQASC